MAVNKNFVVKNGLEVFDDLLVVNSENGTVGVGTTSSRYLLHVNEGTGIGASSVYVTGISTVAQEFNVGVGGSVFTVLGDAEGLGIGQSVGVGTGEPAYLLDIRSPVSTGQTALYVQGDMRVTGDIHLDDINMDSLNVTGLSTFNNLVDVNSNIDISGDAAVGGGLTVAGISTFNGPIDANAQTTVEDLYVAGVATISSLYGSAGIITASRIDVTDFSSTGIATFVDVNVGGALTVSGLSTFSGAVDISGHTELDNTNISGVATVTTLDVTGVSSFASEVDINSNAVILGRLQVGGITTFNTYVTVGDGDGGVNITGYGLTTTELNVVGVATVGGDVDINGGIDVDGHTELDHVNVSGTLTATSLDVQTNFNVYDSDATFHNDVTISGDLNVIGTLVAANSSSLNVTDKDIVLGLSLIHI